MDTPQIGTPTSRTRSEDSALLNYLNSLSPIKTIKPLSTHHPFSSLNFPSPPSVFTSPHLISPHKESRFFKTHNSSSSPTNPVEEVAAQVEDTKNVPLGKEASTEMNHDDLFASPCGRYTTDDVSLVPYGTQGDNDSSKDAGMELPKMYDNVQAKNDTPDWESLISNTSDILSFDVRNDSKALGCHLMQTPSTSETRFCTGVEMRTMQLKPESSHAIHNEIVSRVRRRCLDFETLGNEETLNENNTAACEPSWSRCVVPSIGLHLNTCSRKIQVGLQSSISTLQETLEKTENETRENAYQDVRIEPALEELHMNSRKKKKLKMETGEGELCKRCNCKKSKCLKLYCECFAAGVYCVDKCSCKDCFNKLIHKDTVLATRKQIESRNPLAFAPRVIRSSDSVLETREDPSKTPVSARHKRGCNCKKSNCLKKYCECYQGGVGCSINCRCEGCKNAFGCKDGSSNVDMEAKQEEENEATEKSRTAKTKQNTAVLMRKETSSVLPTTSLPIYRQHKIPFPSSKNMMRPPQSLLGVGSSLGIYNSQYLRKPDISLTQSRIEKSFEKLAEDKAEDMHDILMHSPIANIKSVSPNGKRVSPAHMDSSSSGSILGRKTGRRKLILQSVPSFPSLTPQYRKHFGD